LLLLNPKYFLCKVLIDLLRFIIVSLFFAIFFVTKIESSELEPGKWNFIVNNDYCYIGSTPTKTEIEEGKKRAK